jgi:AraC family transcriptional regulator, regulatory protein of adaptative response / DNA-3-methyladenine glycosylase II
MIEVLRFLAVRAVAGVEAVDGSRYRRSLELAGGAAVAEVSVAGGAASEERRVAGGDARLALRLDDERDRPDALARCRRLLDLDA